MEGICSGNTQRRKHIGGGSSDFVSGKWCNIDERGIVMILAAFLNLWLNTNLSVIRIHQWGAWDTERENVACMPVAEKSAFTAHLWRTSFWQKAVHVRYYYITAHVHSLIVNITFSTTFFSYYLELTVFTWASSYYLVLILARKSTCTAPFLTVF